MTMKYGARKGKMNFFRRWMAKAASRELCLFPVPGPDILRIYQSGPLNGEARLTANPREANVLLIIGDMNPDMAEQAAIVYAQMPRPRMLVLAGPKHLDPLPHPDVHVALEKDFLQTALPAVRECLSNLAWIDEPEPYQPEALVNEIEEAGKQQGHMHHHHHHGHGDHDHSQHSGHGHSHEGHDPSAHQHGNAEEGHDHSAHTHSAHEGHDHSHEEHKNHGHSHSGEAEESKGCHGASDKPGHDHSQDTKHQHEGHDHSGHDHGEHGHEGHEQHGEHNHGSEGHSHSHGQQSGEKKDSHSGHQHGSHSAHQKHRHEGHGHSGHDHGAHHHDHGHEQEDHEHSGHQHGEHSHGHEGHRHGEHDHSQHEEHGHSHGGHDHGAHQHGDHGHGGHDHGSGFMSMIAMTKDLPRSSDGLPMEWSDVQFGPFHPGLPGGLRLSMKMDGDTVAEAEADQELPSRNLLASIPEDPAALPEYLEAINPMAPVTYRLLAQKALLNFSDKAGNSALTLSEAVLLEKERITSHLNWLTVFASTLGSSWMRDQAIKHYHLFQNDTGNRGQLSGFIRRIKKMPYLKLKLSAAVHNPGGTGKHNQEAAGTHKNHHHEHNADSHSGHCHEESDEQKPHDHGGHEGHEHHHGAQGHGEDHKHHEKHGHSHEGHDHGGHQHGEHDHHSHEMHQHTGHETHDHHEHVHHDHASKDEKNKVTGAVPGQLPDDITGPVARAAGIEKDHRLEEAVYQQAGWTPVTAAGNNAWSRLMVRLDEIEQSLRFIEKAGNDSGKESSRKINIPSVGMGNGIAHTESPRGIVTLKFHIHEGKLAHMHLTTPSVALAGLVKPITEQQELADALIAVNSLDISPWEINP